MWCVSDLDDQFVERMEDVLALYERPRDRHQPVVCLDERPVQLHSEVRAGSTAQLGKPARYDYEYVRRGTANVFCAVEPLAGRHLTRATPNRGGAEFAKMIRLIAQRYPRAETIHLVMDNLSTHTERSLVTHLGPRRGARLWSRFTVHYTPKHGSWLNQAEIEIGIVNRQCLGKRRIPTLRRLRREILAWEKRANDEHLRIRWRFTKQDARVLFRL
jgi:transposase